LRLGDFCKRDGVVPRDVRGSEGPTMMKSFQRFAGAKHGFLQNCAGSGVHRTNRLARRGYRALAVLARPALIDAVFAVKADDVRKSP